MRPAFTEPSSSLIELETGIFLAILVGLKGLTVLRQFRYSISSRIHQEVRIVVRIHRTTYAALRVERICVSTESVNYDMKPDTPPYRPAEDSRWPQADKEPFDRSDQPVGMIERRKKR